MANIKIPRKKFEKEIGPLTEEMQEKISMFGTPLEDFDNNEIELEIFPNRPDMLSYEGFKRAFLAFLGKKTGLKKYKLKKPEKNYKVYVDSSVKNIRPYTVCAIAKKIRFDDEKIKEIIELQEKLHLTIGRKRKKVAIGIYPLEKIKPPIIFKALEPDKIHFTPLEAQKEMSGLEILQKHPTGQEYAHLLSGKTKFPIFIDSENNILSMPPIINSHSTGRIDEKTKEIFIECSGHDLETLKKCLNIIITTLYDMGADIYQMEIDNKKKENTPDLTPEITKISIENTNKILGTEIIEKEMKKLLEKSGHDYNPKAKKVESPAWRNDILHELDIIEDIAITYGYENLEPVFPEIATTGQEAYEEKIKRKIAEILSGLGFLEVSNFHLTTKRSQIKNMGLNEKNISERFTKIEESKTDYSLLRENLSHYLLKNLSENIDSEYPQKIFETGRIFKLSQENKIIEKESLSISITPGNFTELKQTLEYLFKMLDLKIQIKEAKEKPEHMIEGRTAEIILNEKTIGYIGEIHPKILKNLKIKMPVSILELDLEDVFEGLES